MCVYRVLGIMSGCIGFRRQRCYLNSGESDEKKREHEVETVFIRRLWGLGLCRGNPNYN